MTRLEQFQNRHGIDGSFLRKTLNLAGAALVAGSAMVGGAFAAEQQAERPVLTVNADTMPVVQVMDERASSELEGLNTFRKLITSVQGIAEKSENPDARADAVQTLLDTITASEPQEMEDGTSLDPAEFDNHVIEMSKHLPKTGAIKDLVDGLTYKRDTIASAVDAVHDIQVSFYDGDPDKVIDAVGKFESIMSDYELATKIEDQAAENSAGPDPNEVPTYNDMLAQEDSPDLEYDFSDESSWTPIKRQNISSQIGRLQDSAVEMKNSNGYEI